MSGSSPSLARVGLIYIATLAAAVAIFLVIRQLGAELSAATELTTSAAEPSRVPPHNAIIPVLVAMIAIIATGRVLSRFLEIVHQPPVIGEVAAGIFLGPSVLGAAWPDATAFVLPTEVAPYLRVIAQLGVILYMFLVGLDLNAEPLRYRVRSTFAISHASIVLPFLLGAALSLGVYRDYASRDGSFTTFSFFVGVSMAVTAFPVLARILTDRGMEKSELGVMALSCAAIGDVTAWCLLALAVGVASAQVGQAFVVIGMALAFIAIIFLVVGPIARRLLTIEDPRSPSRRQVTWLLAAVLASALTTEAMGVHAIFGAFLLGAVIPHDSAVARDLTRKLSDTVSILLLPAFFAYTGMQTRIGLLDTLQDWLICGAITIVATFGKFGGTFVAARISGLNSRTAASLGVLMNTRGLMELIVLNIGLELGILSEKLFAMMVLMALATTLATTPVLTWLERRWRIPSPSFQPGHASSQN